MSYPYLPNRWLVTTPDLIDDEDVFPLLPGQGFLSQKAPGWTTTVRTAASGRQVRANVASTPIWRFKVAYEFLRDRPTQAELARLYGFFCSRQGQLGSFYYYDPNDNLVSNQPVATADGARTRWQLTRTLAAGFASAFTEPVYVLNGAPSISVGGVATTAFTIGEYGVLSFASPPPEGQAITWSGSFLYWCHFTQDDMAPAQMVKSLWSPGRAGVRKPEAMKTATGQLADFLLTAQSFVRADLYTFALPGGEVLRYAGADMAIPVGARSFGLGPLCQDEGVRSQRGVYVSTVDVTFYADERHTVDGAPFLNFVEDFGLDGASVTIERAVAASWADMAAQGPVGTWIRFAGRVSQVQTLGRTQAVVSCASWLDLLSTRLPADVYQSSCLNSLGDARCGVALAGFAVGGQVGGAATQTSFPTALTQPAGWFDLGKVVFTSGANAGLARTVKRFDASGDMVLVSPLPSAPAAGDAFTAYPGCDLSMTTCQGKFANLARFRGQPFVPQPTTGLPT